MTRAEFLRYLIGRGFAARQALEIADRVLRTYVAEGKSEEEALSEIAERIRRGDRFEAYLAGGEVSPLAAATSEEPFEVCPNCGHPRAPEVPGITRPGECAHCGIIFSKIKPKEAGETDIHVSERKENIVSPSGGPLLEAIARPPGFFARYKSLIVMVAALLIVVVVGLLLQSRYRSEFQDVLRQFDEQLSMDSQETFETSLDNLQYVIEKAAVMVAKRGWSKKDVEWFYGETQERLNKFLDMMDERAVGEEILYEHSIGEIKQNLGSGMHLLLTSIRNEDSRLGLMERSASAVDTLDPNFDPEQSVRQGYYLGYHPEQYRPSSRMQLVRQSNRLVLQENAKARQEQENIEPFVAGAPEQETSPEQ